MWTTHYLDARGALTDLRLHVDRAIESVATRTDSIVPPIELDIVVEANRWVIPEIGMVGRAPRSGVVILTLDPKNPALAMHLGETLERTLAHELHHALRWDAVGYGDTLLEVLVSERLACRFAHELYGNPPEPWECALDPGALPPFAAEALQEAESTSYHHGAWFFGSRDKPKWLGYTLGYHLVAEACDSMSKRPSELVATPAEEFRETLTRIVEA